MDDLVEDARQRLAAARRCFDEAVAALNEAERRAAAITTCDNKVAVFLDALENDEILVVEELFHNRLNKLTE